jgi:uncharacterized protein
MDLLLDLHLWLILCATGFIAGFIDAIVGGGGMLTIPALLTTGLPPHMALGTNKLAATFGSFTASLTFYRKKLFDIRYWRYSLIATAISAIFGTLVVNLLTMTLLEKLLPIIIMATALYTLFSKTIINNGYVLPTRTQHIKIKQVLQGTVLGFYDGVAGPGTGAFWASSSAVLYKINILLCSGLARANNFVSNFCSLLTFIYLGQVNLLLGISMGFFIMLGSWLGAHSAIKWGGKFIRPVFIVVVLCLSVNLALKVWN